GHRSQGGQGYQRGQELEHCDSFETGPKGLRVVDAKTSNGIVTSGLLLRRSGSLDDDRPGAPTIGCLEPLGVVIGHLHLPLSSHCETVVLIDEVENVDGSSAFLRVPPENVRRNTHPGESAVVCPV